MALVGTYRLQLGPACSFDDAAALVPYLAALGVSHLYLSPILQAGAGSTHGYDVIDHARLSDDLGGDAGYRRLCTALRRAGLSQVVDVVPNHMAAAAENRWWWDVLENGPASVEADTFDIDWAGLDQRRHPALLAPVLGDHYGTVLEAGELTLWRHGGRVELRYGEHRFPVAPRTLDVVLATAAQTLRAGGDEPAGEVLGFFADAFGALPGSWRTDPGAVARRHRDKEVLAELLDRALGEHPPWAAAVDEELVALTTDPERLDALLDRQNYRLAHWRSGAYELDYRRFFDITTLVALRMDRRDVFERSHALLLDLVAQGCIDGLRIDHPDGLRDPAGYLRWLADAAPRCWIVVEKILAPGEALPCWPVAGTTGYEFAAALGGLHLDPAGEAPLSELHAELSGEHRDFPAQALDAKRLVLRRLLPADLSRLAALFQQVCDAERTMRDHPAVLLGRALEEALVSFTVYRTYVGKGQDIAPGDEARIREALAAAAARPDAADVPWSLFAFLGDVLCARRGGAQGAELAARFQQLTAPIAAKGIEDTVGYRYSRLAPLCEVGCDPGHYGMSVTQFHAQQAAVAARWPTTMVATSTHDTKRSEDVRARLSLLSERAEDWAAQVRAWRRRPVAYRAASVDGWAEKYLYELLVGAHPLPRERAEVVLAKALREAKLATSWLDPDFGYEADVSAFLHGLYADEAFQAELAAFVAPLVIPGRMVSLSMVLARHCCPGVADLYQGTEGWDSSLVDPDNRRPVDGAALAAQLDRLRALDPNDPARLDLADDSGTAKLHTITTALAVRRRHANCFDATATYAPVRSAGEAADCVVAFSRGSDVVAVLPRLLWARTRRDSQDSQDSQDSRDSRDSRDRILRWGDTTIELPAGSWVDALTGAEIPGGTVGLDRVLARFPVALLTRQG